MSRKSKKPKSENLRNSQEIHLKRFTLKQLEVIGLCLLLTTMVWAVYGQTVNHEFISYDDNLYVYENPTVTQGLTLDGIIGSFTHKELGLWNPLVTISHMLDVQIYGLWPGGHHLTNVLLHLASVLLLFLILHKMTNDLWPSAFVSALFAIHPLRVESVAWIAERKDVLSGLFFMLTLGAYLYYISHMGSWARRVAVLFLYACGLMSKPMLVTLPFLLLLLDYWPLRRLFKHSELESASSPWLDVNWRTVAEKIPLILLSLILCCVILVEPKEPTYPLIESITFWVRMGLAPVWLLIYLGQMVWPAGLAVIYPHPENYSSWWPAALSLYTLLSFGIFLLRKKHPYLLMGWLWNLGMMVPVLGIVQISRHSQADHYNYLPQIGLYIAGAWTLMACRMKWKYQYQALASGALIVLVALILTAHYQTSLWYDSTKLWNHTLSCTSHNNVAYNNLGVALFHKGKTEEAIAAYRNALLNASSYAEAHNNLGAALFQQGKTDEAMTHIQEALQSDSSFADAHNNLGKALYLYGKIPEAIAAYHRALQINPVFSDAHHNLGLALFQQGKIEEAFFHLRESLRVNPSYAKAHDSLGVALYQQGKTEESLIHFQKALELQPDNVEYQHKLAWVLATASETSLRNGVRAVQLASQANQATGGNNIMILRTLAAAYAQTGEFSNAEQTAQKALRLAKISDNPSLAKDLLNELKLYKTSRPFQAGSIAN